MLTFSNNILAATCYYFSITLSDLAQKRRPARIAYPRQIATYLLRESGMTVMEVSRFFSQRHATTRHAILKVIAAKGTEREDVQNIRRVMNGEHIKKRLRPKVIYYTRKKLSA